MRAQDQATNKATLLSFELATLSQQEIQEQGQGQGKGQTTVAN
jgi:hypothetical protein